MSRGEMIEEMSELAEALFEIIEEEDGGGDDVRRAVIEAMAQQNLFNIELVSALNVLSRRRQCIRRDRQPRNKHEIRPQVAGCSDHGVVG